MVGCSTIKSAEKQHYETIGADPTRDTKSAEGHHSRALKIMEDMGPASPPHCNCGVATTCDLHKAEKLLEKSLLADVRYGPAHNTLGTLRYRQQNYYLAAWEFDHAARLMPDYAEPLNNLGLTYEAAGRLDVAISYYSLAHEKSPKNPVYLGNLIKAQLKQGVSVIEVRDLLSELIFLDTRHDWSQWARDMLGQNSGLPIASMGAGESYSMTDKAPEAAPLNIDSVSVESLPLPTEMLVPQQPKSESLWNKLDNGSVALPAQ